MNIELIFLYCFFAITQIFIFISQGVLAGKKHIFSEKTLEYLSNILINLFFPIYGIKEISQMASPNNLASFWLMAISVILSMMLAYYLCLFFQYFFKLDIRISHSFCLLCCLPSLGTFALVLGRAFCFRDGPLEKDPKCENIQGYMMVNYLIHMALLFMFGFNLIAKDINLGYKVDAKLSYIWCILISKKIVNKDYWVLYIFEKYFKKNKNFAKKKFEEFIENNYIRYKESFNYEFCEKIEKVFTKEKDCENGGKICEQGNECKIEILNEDIYANKEKIQKNINILNNNLLNIKLKTPIILFKNIDEEIKYKNKNSSMKKFLNKIIEKKI